MNQKLSKPTTTLSLSRRRLWTFLLGIAAMAVVVVVQLPFLKWTLQFGHLSGMDAGKTRLQFFWNTLALMADTGAFTAWIILRPYRWWWSLVAGGGLFLLWILAFFGAIIVSTVLRLFGL